MSQNPVILSAVRTAIGSFGGSLKGHSPTQLAALCTRDALARAKVSGDKVGQVVFGNVIHTESRDMYLARVAGIEGGVGLDAGALTLNRLCGSGLQAIVTACMHIVAGDAACVVAGGSEVMSRAPFASLTHRWGERLGDAKLIDMLLGSLTDPFGNGHMGVTAENVAERYGISRDLQDALAAESQRRASEAIAAGRFRGQIVPVEVRKGRKTATFDQDEHVRPDSSVEALSSLRAAFREDGTVTAGNASGINDGAAALVLASETYAVENNLHPIARIVGHAVAGVAPDEMGVGPIPATRKLLERTDLKVSDFDVVESNEAFAAQACAVASELGLDPERTNPNGGAIALGHPIGATGAILMVKLLHELERVGGRYGLVTMCIGGGQGIAVAVEAMY